MKGQIDCVNDDVIFHIIRLLSDDRGDKVKQEDILHPPQVMV